MGFFSKLAKKIVNKDDDEAAEVIRRNTLPPPTRRPVALEGTPAPITPMTSAPPTRVTMPPDLGPPPGIGEYNNAQMEDALAEQRKLLSQGDYSNASIGAGGNIEGARFPAMAPNIPPPTRTVATVDAVPPPINTEPVVPRPVRTFVGESYKGQSPVRRAATRLRVTTDAAPESKVRDTGEAYEVDAPQKLGRLRGMWEGFKQLLPAGGQYGTGGIIGSGTVGAIQGLISPGTVQKRGREMEIAQAQGDLARAQGVEAMGLQNDSRRIQNLQNVAELGQYEDDRDLKLSQEQRIEWQQGLSNIAELQKRQATLDPKGQQYATAEQAIQQEADRLSRRTGRKVTVIPGNANLNQLPRFEVDGQVIQQQYDGQWKPVYGSPKSATDDENADLRTTYEWQTKNADNEGKRGAAMQEATAMEATAGEHQKRVTEIAGQITVLDQQMAGMSPRDPALGPLKRQRDQLKQAQSAQQKGMEDAYEKANKAKAEAAKFPTLPPPPKRVRRSGGSTASTNSNMSLSKSAWLSAHPGGDWLAAEAEAARRKIPVIQ